MRTLEETRELARGSDSCDPLYASGNPAAEVRVTEVNGSLLLTGTHYYRPDGTEASGEYADDLLITPEDEGWHLYYRDPEGLPTDHKMWGREWVDGGYHAEWDSLVDVAYSL